MEEEREELVGSNTVEKGLSLNHDTLIAEKVDLTVDQVIEEYVGSFGISQLLHVFLVSVTWIFDAHSTLVTLFTDAQPAEWRCIISSSSSCRSNSRNATAAAASVCGLKPGTWEWIGGNTSSTIAEWGLICDSKYLAALPASLYFLGSLIGAALIGRLADGLLGRKRALVISCLLTSATTFICSISPNIWVYAFFRFVSGFSRAGIGICCLVLSTEAVGRKWRGQVGQFGFFFFTAGFMSLPVIAYPARTCWRNMYKVISLLPLVYSIFILLPFVSESPRWLLIRGRSKEALDVLKQYARINGRTMPENLCLLEHSLAVKKVSTGEDVLLKKTIWNTKGAARRLVLVMIIGFGIGFVYYGLQLNVENVNFNMYFTVAVNATMEIPAAFFGSLLLSMANRRVIFSHSAYIAGISSILCILLANVGDKSGGSWPQLALEAIGFMAMSTAFDVLYIFCVELFPTNARNFAVSMLRQALMLGASMAPLLVAVGRLIPYIGFLVFGLVSIFSGALSWWLPETRNSPLYETLEQQEQEEKPVSAPTELDLEL